MDNFIENLNTKRSKSLIFSLDLLQLGKFDQILELLR
jgi:hypothetical protein